MVDEAFCEGIATEYPLVHNAARCSEDIFHLVYLGPFVEVNDDPFCVEELGVVVSDAESFRSIELDEAVPCGFRLGVFVDSYWYR